MFGTRIESERLFSRNASRHKRHHGTYLMIYQVQAHAYIDILRLIKQALVFCALLLMIPIVDL